jgi:hypothetical protein
VTCNAAFVKDRPNPLKIIVRFALRLGRIAAIQTPPPGKRERQQEIGEDPKVEMHGAYLLLRTVANKRTDGRNRTGFSVGRRRIARMAGGGKIIEWYCAWTEGCCELASAMLDS